MKLGFTGTQIGMTDLQKLAIQAILICSQPTEIHVGDCIGADTDFYQLAKLYNKDIITVGHIPEYDSKRSKLAYTVECEPKPYLVRNHDIVDNSDVLLATPKEDIEQLRSGTWATIRYAKKTGKRVVIIFPDGNSEKFNF